MGVRPATECVERGDFFVSEQHCDGDEAVGVAGFEEGGGAGVLWLDEAVGGCREGGCGCVWEEGVCEIER